MARAKHAKPAGDSTQETVAGNGQIKEKLTNKAEAVRRALAQLGKKAKPAEIQVFIKGHFDVEMSTQVISVYKSKLTKKSSKKSKSAPKPKETGVVGAPAPKAALHEAVSFKDLRSVREISNRLGPARMRELVALIID